MEEKVKELEKRIEQLEAENVTSKECIRLITNNISIITNNISKLTEAMDKVSIIVKSIVNRIF